jgi:hypothetical protein
MYIPTFSSDIVKLCGTQFIKGDIHATVPAWEPR